jgi:hypothetical protein
MLQSGDGVKPVTFEDLVICVVQENDIASANASQTLDYGGLVRHPIVRTYRPHDHASAAVVADDAIEMGPAKAVRRPHPARRITNCIGNSAVAPVKVAVARVCRKKREIRVCLRVIADRMPHSGDLLCDVRERADVLANQEEGGTHVVPRQKVE